VNVHSFCLVKELNPRMSPNPGIPPSAEMLMAENHGAARA